MLLRIIDTDSLQAARTRVELKNCQSWLRELVKTLAANGTLPDGALVELTRPLRIEDKYRFPENWWMKAGHKSVYSEWLIWWFES